MTKFCLKSLILSQFHAANQSFNRSFLIQNISIMKNTFLAVVAILSLSAFSVLQDALPIGATLPKGDVKMKDVNGSITTLNEAKAANGLLVMFSCNTCPYVVKNQSRTREICNYALENKIGVIIINSNDGNRDSDDSYAAMQSYAKSQNYKWHYVLDSNNEIADAFGAKRTPECYLFSKEGKLVYHGAIDDNPADITNVKRVHVKEAINEMLSGKDISVKESRSIGCGIKRKG
jgi:thioredoxin-related protein